MAEEKRPSRIFLGEHDGLGKKVRREAAVHMGQVANRTPFDVDGWLIKPLRGLLAKHRNECPRSTETDGGKSPVSRCGLTYGVAVRSGITKGSGDTVVGSACGVAGEQCLRLCEELTAAVTTAVEVSGARLSQD